MEGKVIFSRSIATDRLPILQWTVLYTYENEQHWLDSVSYREKKEDMKFRGGHFERDLGEMETVYD